MSRPIIFVDLYCGCGGFTTGAHEAFGELGLLYREIAINHWLRAIETMQANHPDVVALKMDIEAATSKDIGVKVIDLLHASPSCTHHSRAKGGKPCDDQLRSQPNEIWKFVDNIHVRRITIENVPEFVNWGPLTTEGKPIKRKMGECFQAWLQQFKARGYTYEWRILNCADYGDATSRRRFFLQAVKHGCGKIKWPEPTHEENPQPDFFGRTLKPWRGICECLDYSDTGRSIFGREDPIAEKTLRRVVDGLRKYCKISLPLDVLMSSNQRIQKHAVQLGKEIPLRPFLVKLNNHATTENTDAPLTTVTTSGNHHELCQPFIVRLRNNQDCADIGKPLSAISYKMSAGREMTADERAVEEFTKDMIVNWADCLARQYKKIGYAVLDFCVAFTLVYPPNDKDCPALLAGAFERFKEAMGIETVKCEEEGGVK